MLRNRLYYGLKPIIPLAFRLKLRRWFALRKLRACRDYWPVSPGSEKPPEGWLGWPKGKKFALVLTHDVEGERGYASVLKLMWLERSQGFHSSFNLIPKGTYRVSKELRQALIENGFEVGVHDLYHDGKLFLTEREFKRNAPEINRYLGDWGAVGFRSGFMLHNLEWMHDLNIEYDLSTFDTDPFEPQPEGIHSIFPFWVSRNATPGPQVAGAVALDSRVTAIQSGSSSAPGSSSSGPIHLSIDQLASGSSASGSRLGYMELPYTLPQDSTIFLLLGERSPAVWVQKLDWIAQHGGMALINVHPDYIQFDGDFSTPRTYPASFYSRFLEIVNERYGDSCWRALPKEVADFAKRSLVDGKHQMLTEERKPNLGQCR